MIDITFIMQNIIIFIKFQYDPDKSKNVLS